MKQCTKCKITKNIDQFYVKKTGNIYSNCKDCTNLKNKLWRSANKDKVYLYNKKWDDNNKDRRSEWAKKLKNRYRLCKNSAIDRQYEFLLSLDEFKILTEKECHYCKESKSDYRGIDRRNNDVGYIFNNCVPCCKNCNLAKNDMNIEEFKDWILSIYRHFVEQVL